MKPMFAQVVLPIPLRAFLTYAMPASMTGKPGTLVLVPVGRSQQVGVLWSLSAEPAWNLGKIRDILEILEDRPLLDADLLHLLAWISSYYLCPIGSVVAAAVPGHLRFQKRRRVVWQGDAQHPGEIPDGLPPPLKSLAEWLKKRKQLTQETLEGRLGRATAKREVDALLRRGLVTREDTWKSRHNPQGKKAAPPASAIVPPSSTPLNPPADSVPPPVSATVTLTEDQALQVKRLDAALQTRTFTPFLLHGVTGSGKTEVYFRAVDTCLALGRQALLLVPEISLTPQLVQRYKDRFQVAMAIFHSKLSDQKRFDYWQQIRDGQARVVIGARSAIFAPFADLGLIVVDEEHDASYKQEGTVPYQARDMAVVRARKVDAVLILGSATPSLESLANCDQGRYTRLMLDKRATGASLPPVEMINLSETALRESMRFNELLSLPMREALQKTLETHGQSLLFLNRRGFSPTLLCRCCGHKVSCPNCSVTLTLHKSKSCLLCHYCDHRQRLQDVCDACGQRTLFAFGPGTERLEHELCAAFPAARIARLDRDTVSSGRVDLEATLEAFRDQKLDILLGTQMIAKGHHFPGLVLVGVVQAETTLCQPDFRAAERTFQLVTQVAGRAGREEGMPGRVLVQSYDPGHYALQSVLQHDVAGFVAKEKAFRQEAAYPPYRRLALLRFSSTLLKEGEAFDLALRTHLPATQEVEFLGPAPSPLFKLRNRYRWQLMIKEKVPGRLHAWLKPLLDTARQLASHRLRVALDVDPYTFL